MPKHFKSATASIPKELYEAFEKKCGSEGLSIHMKIKNFIEGEIESEQRGSVKGNRRDVGRETQNISSTETSASTETEWRLWE